MPTRGSLVVRAAGGVLWRDVTGTDGGHETEVALVHRHRYDDWSLPKGKIEAGEHLAVTACREVAEETGFVPVLGAPLIGQAYPVTATGGRPATKQVSFWAMRAQPAGTQAPAAIAGVIGSAARTGEVDEVRWLSLTDARAMLTRPADATTLDSFTPQLRDTVAIALLRHASAGTKSRWRGPDRNRPVDKRGKLQAAAAASVLPWYGIAQVLCAPLARCVGTAEPLAKALGFPVELSEGLAEDHNIDGIAAALEVSTAAIEREASVVLCSQGGVIPALVDTYAADALAGIHSGNQPPPARKGSVWVLHFSDRKLVAAEYHATLDAPPA
jgi:8-oxo-dGTP pyrophosphatase MutT (NUDIX family)/phosphohistidine phosphatase SixA